MLTKPWMMLCCLLCSAAFAPGTQATTQVGEMKNCFRGPFSSYESWVEALSTKKPDFNAQAFARAFPAEKFQRYQQQLDCFDFTYEVDGLTVEGYYLAPRERDTNTPVVIYNRGGNAEFGYVMFAKKMMLQAELAEAGYIVIGSQYRGASARFIDTNGSDEFGGADINDVLALTDVLAQIPGADPQNIALVGWSRGVMQSYLAATKMDNVKAIVSIAGAADLNKGLAWRPQMEKVFSARIPDYAIRKSEALAERSVINWLDELPPAPILLIHGSADKRVNAEQSRMLSAALNEVGHDNKLVIYDNDNHGLSNHRADMLQEVLTWLNEHLR